MACLKLSGKTPSEIDKFIKVVIGRTRASRHNLSRGVGKESRGHVASDDNIIAFRTFSAVAGTRLERGRRGVTGAMCGDLMEWTEDDKLEHRVEILSPTKSKNDLTKSD